MNDFNYESLATQGLSGKEDVTYKDSRKLGAYHMIGDDDYEPQRSNNFELHIYGLNNLKSASGNVVSKETDPRESLVLSTVSVGQISTEVSTIEVPFGNTKAKFAGIPTVSNSDIVYNDFIGKNTERVIAAWHALVFNPVTEKVGRASDYKKEALLIETDPSGDNIKAWRLKGCWPSSVNYGAYDYGNNNVRQITMSLTYDIAIPLDNI